MKNIARARDLVSGSTDYVELAEILTRQIENILIYPLARLGNLRQSDLETIEEVGNIIRLIALNAENFEKWKLGELLEDSVN
jgi:hypothetical protein